MKLNNILRPGGDNLGGGAGLFFQERSALNLVPDAQNGQINASVSLKAGQLWCLLEHVRDTLRYREDFSSNRNGNFYKARLQLVIAKDTPNLQSELQNLEGRDLVFIFKDQNGQARLIGNKQEYLRLNADYDSGSNPASRNELTITFEGQIKRRAPYYLGAFPVVENKVPSPPVAFCQPVRLEDQLGNLVLSAAAGSTVPVLVFDTIQVQPFESFSASEIVVIP